jgi:hypothetical protein
MTSPSHQAPDSPEVGDVDTESLYGAAPDGSTETPAAEDETELASGTADE